MSTLGDLILGIDAHVNRDLAFVYFRLGAKNRDDHLFVDTVLTRTRPIAYPEIIAELDPTLAGQAPNDTALSLDVFAWRELAWTNAARLAAARNAAARRSIAAGIERHSIAMARTHQGSVSDDRRCEPGEKRVLRAGQLGASGATSELIGWLGR